jgi:ABC-2 type transport system ATP-binding protein/lipopolysaccharide transport system ATP-binding protein
MAGSAIEVQSVSKRYRLGELPTANTIREAVTQSVSQMLRRGDGTRDEPREIWALRDANLEIPEGATLGIVGRNGAGKSTLLKILARITEPTSGVSRTRGSVGSLLEVGTGFHPELSGRENIFLNAAILGMPREAVARRLDDIVDFSGIGRFLDTPVKRYSSGMYLRLAFAVAAHVEADVLLVDEVLAVGDAEFQRRCLGAMEDIGRSGRTVVFISHNLDAVTRLCSTTLWLDAGRVRALGPTSDVVDAYLLEATPDEGSRTFDDDRDSPVALRSVQLRSVVGHSAGRIRREDPFAVDLEFVVRDRVPGLDVAVSVETLTGVRLLDEAVSDTWGVGAVTPMSERGYYRVSLVLPPLLMPGEYVVNVWSGTTYETLVWEHAAARLRLEGSHQARPDRLLVAQGTWRVDTLNPR